MGRDWVCGSRGCISLVGLCPPSPIKPYINEVHDLAPGPMLILSDIYIYIYIYYIYTYMHIYR